MGLGSENRKKPIPDSGSRVQKGNGSHFVQFSDAKQSVIINNLPLLIYRDKSSCVFLAVFRIGEYAAHFK